MRDMAGAVLSPVAVEYSAKTIEPWSPNRVVEMNETEASFDHREIDADLFEETEIVQKQQHVGVGTTADKSLSTIRDRQRTASQPGSRKTGAGFDVTRRRRFITTICRSWRSDRGGNCSH